MPANMQTSPASTEEKRSVSLAQANKRLSVMMDLKAEVRAGKLDVAGLLDDGRAASVRVLTLLTMIPRCSQRVALDALLVCQVNGARSCGDLTGAERAAVVDALQAVRQSHGRPATSAVLGDEPLARDLVIDQGIRESRQAIPVVELRPSEFAAARTGLEVDPLLLRMVDRLVWGLRAYVNDDDGGRIAAVVLDQWLRYRNYLKAVAEDEYPRPTLKCAAEVE